MRKFMTVLLLATSLFLPLVAAATPASADDRTCYTPHVGSFNSFEVCYFLPIEPTQ